MLPSNAIIEGVRQLGKTPATVNRKTGVLYLNSDIVPMLNEDQLFFVMLHEMAHVVLQTKDESEADNWAFKQYQKTGRSLKDSVLVLAKMFRYDNHITDEEYKRMTLQLKRAQIADR